MNVSTISNLNQTREVLMSIGFLLLVAITLIVQASILM